MPIVHVKKTTHNFARDQRLTWKARGLLAYLLSHEDDWEVNVEDLIQQSDEDGRGIVRAALQELLRLKYAILETRRHGNGTVAGKHYIIYEVPFDSSDLPSHRATDRRLDGRSVTPTDRSTDGRFNRRTVKRSLGEDHYAVIEAHRQTVQPTDGLTDGRSNGLITKDKIRKEKKGSAEGKHQERSLPEDFGLLPGMQTWAQEHTPSLNAQDETDKFMDWARSKGITSLDWVARWRNWMRKALEMNQTPPRKRGVVL